jgi:FkbM family methyltransferase
MVHFIARVLGELYVYPIFAQAEDVEFAVCTHLTTRYAARQSVGEARVWQVRESVRRFIDAAIASFVHVGQRIAGRKHSYAVRRFRNYCQQLPALIEEPVFVKVGANDGVTMDPCSDILLSDPRWRGVLIEPVPYCFDRLKANFSDPDRFVLEQVAIGAIPGRAAFYYVDQRARADLPGIPDWFDQIGSFNRDHILKHLDGVLAPYIGEILVEVCSLANVIERSGMPYPQLIHIDTEGCDFEILKTLDFSHMRPLLILAEHKHVAPDQKREMLQLLRKHGYRVRDCGADYFAADERTIARLMASRGL